MHDIAEETAQATTESTPPEKLRETPPPIAADDSHIVAAYTNFCRVTGTPEELVVDFGLNMQGAGAPTHPIKLTQRAVMNFYTAKRLLGALQMAVSRHEQAFGVLETNIQKRVTPQPR